jgi:NADPH:quinone reductase-like Zn-dependent oxidoreductase
MSTAITFSRYGEPGVLTVSATDVPEPGRGQVRIRVRAVAVNLIDTKIRSGHMDGIFPIRFPVTPGWDVAGVVDAASDNAPAAVGDEVFGVASVGGYSEYALLDHPVVRPEGLSEATAAALVTVGEAAYRGLAHLGVKAGQTLLIHGAAGSVGTIAVQLAVARGLTVIGTAAAGDLEHVTALGAVAIRYGDGRADPVRPGWGGRRVRHLRSRPAGRVGHADGRRHPRHHHRRRGGRGAGRALHRRRPRRPFPAGPAGTCRAGRVRPAQRADLADLPAGASRPRAR